MVPNLCLLQFSPDLLAVYRTIAGRRKWKLLVQCLQLRIKCEISLVLVGILIILTV